MFTLAGNAPLLGTLGDRPDAHAEAAFDDRLESRSHTLRMTARTSRVDRALSNATRRGANILPRYCFFSQGEEFLQLGGLPVSSEMEDIIRVSQSSPPRRKARVTQTRLTSATGGGRYSCNIAG